MLLPLRNGKELHKPKGKDGNENEEVEQLQLFNEVGEECKEKPFVPPPIYKQ